MSISSSIAFLFLCIAFINNQLYEAIIQTLSKRKALGTAIDPEFVSSAYVFSELYLKTNRSKMNIWGMDFFVPGTGFKLYYGAITFLIMISILGILLIHFGLIWIATWPDENFTLASIVIFLASSAMNLAGLALTLSPAFRMQEAQLEIELKSSN